MVVTTTERMAATTAIVLLIPSQHRKRSSPGAFMVAGHLQTAPLRERRVRHRLGAENPGMALILIAITMVSVASENLSECNSAGSARVGVNACSAARTYCQRRSAVKQKRRSFFVSGFTTASAFDFTVSQHRRQETDRSRWPFTRPML